jgi:hypothetical protein
MQKTTTFLFCLILAVACFQAMRTALAKQESVECQEWRSQSRKYPGFYATRWQTEQCQAYGIDLE